MGSTQSGPSSVIALSTKRPLVFKSHARGFVKAKDGMCVAIIVLVFVFYLLTIRGGQPWPDDFAMYILEAKNIAQNVPLDATGYVYNPYNPGVGPKLYPPVFPVLLVPGYLIGGLNNLTPMKVEIVVFFVAILVVLWRVLGTDLHPPHRAAMLAIVGFNPLLWAYKDGIISDIPFTFFLYVTLALADRFVGDLGSAAKSFWRILALGGLVYLCYGMRTIGIVLVPALVLFAAVYWRRGGRSVAEAASLGLILCLIQRRFFGAETTYLDQFKLPLGRLVEDVFRNALTYGWSLSSFWENPYTKILRDIIFIAVTCLALLAYFRRVKTTPRIYEIFLPIYLAVVLLWPNPGGARYLIPIVPLYVYYSLEGAEILKRWLQIRRTEAILIPLLVVIFLSYGAEFSHSDFGPFKEGVSKKEAGELFAYIKSNTHSKDVFIFRRPRALALFTGRRASVYPESQNEANFCRYFQTIGATYLIEAPAIDDPNFDEFLMKELPAKQLVFANSDFRVFHIRSDDLERCAGEAASAHSPPFALTPMSASRYCRAAHCDAQNYPQP